jgi:hypothetical protein
MMILVRLIASTSLWRPQRHNHGQDRADSDDADRDVPSAGRRVPIAVAEDDHGHKLRDRVYGTKCCRTHSTTTRPSATTAIMLRPYRFVGTQVRQQHISAAEGYLDTSAAPRPPPTGASFGDFGRRERALLGGGAKKLARSTVVELAVIRYGRAAV